MATLDPIPQNKIGEDHNWRDWFFKLREKVNVTTSTIATGIVSSFNTRVGAITLTSSDITTALGFTPTTGTGTVTSVSVVTANGVSGTVATATTTPAITLALGAITPTSVSASGTVLGSNLSGTNTGDQTSIVGITGSLSDFNTALTGADFATGGGTITGTSTGTNTGDQTSVTGNAGTVTVVDAGGDTTTWPMLAVNQTGSMSPTTDTELTYNATTNLLSAGSLALGRAAIGTNTLAVSGTVLITKDWVAPDPANLTLTVDSYGDFNRFAMRRANGTLLAPTGVLTGDGIGNINFRGFTSAGSFSLGVASITGIAEENFTATSQGTRLQFNTTPIGSVTAAEAMRMSPSGGVNIGTYTTDPGINNLKVAGTVTTAQFISTVATGTAPLVVASTTVVPNLNANLLNGAGWGNPLPIGAATPNTGKFTTLALTGKLITYNNVTTAGWGVPAILAAGRSVGATAAVASVSTYTVPGADGSFEVSANVLVTVSTTHSFNVSVTYTDEGNTARTLVLNFSTLAGVISNAPIANLGGAVPYEGVPMHIRCKAATVITVLTSGTFTAVTYNVEGIIRQLA